jgi:fructoselysine-6-P-deglycase FrlB-like protein
VTLIRFDEITQQASLWRRLLERLPQGWLTRTLAWPPNTLVVAVAEGSSYNAARLAFFDWARWGVPFRTLVLRPWELEQSIRNEAPWLSSPDTVYLPVTQSGRTRSLLTAFETLQQFRVEQRLAKLTTDPIQGLLLTNNPSPPTPLCTQTFCLDAGPEEAIAATKSMTGTLLALWLMGLGCLEDQQTRLAKGCDSATFGDAFDRFSKSVEDWLEPFVSEALFHETLAPVGEGIAGSAEFHPALAILSRGPLTWALAEVSLKLMETTRQPVMYYHSENFKHGPKAMLSGSPVHPRPPCLLYMVPPDLAEATLLLADCRDHMQQFESLPETVRRPKRLWVTFEGGVYPPDRAEWANDPCWVLPKPLFESHATLLLLVGAQLLGLYVAERLGLCSHGLSKAVSE